MTVSGWLIGIVLFVASIVARSDAQGTFLEHSALPLYVLLSCVLAFIIVNRFVKDTLLELSNLTFVIFFIVRIPFIYSDLVISDVYRRGVDATLVPGAFYLLAFQFVALSVCVIAIRPIVPKIVERPFTSTEAGALLKIAGVILAFNIWYLLSTWAVGESRMPNVVAIALALFTYTNVLFFLAPCLLLFDKAVAIEYRILLYVELGLVALCVMYAGSKSGVFQILLFFALAVLALRGANYRLSIRAGLSLVVAVAIGVMGFFLGAAFNFYQRKEVAAADIPAFASAMFGDAGTAIAAISYRVGYLDFYIDKVTNPVYAKSFALSSYAKAVIDAITPGFNVFRQPLVSRSVYSDVFGASSGPNSEAVTVFAEAHRLAGFSSVLIFALVLLTIRSAARRLSARFYVARVLAAVFVVYAMQQYLIGFGLDYWLFGTILYPFLFLSLSERYLSRVLPSDEVAAEAVA